MSSRITALVVLALAVAGLTATTSASAQDAGFVVEPNEGLRDGDLVSFSGPAAGESFVAFQCPEATGICLTGDGRVESYTQADGVFAVQRFIVNSSGRLVDCALTDCELVRVGSTTEGQLLSYDRSSLSFEVENAMVTLPNGDRSQLVGGTVVDVPPGSAAWTMRCTGFERQIVCGDVGTVTTDFTGLFEGVAPRGGELEVANGQRVPCEGPSCRVAIVAIDGDGRLVAILGAPSS